MALMIRPQAILVGVAVCAATLATDRARADATGTAACERPTSISGEVARVIDSRSFALTDGPEVRLAAVEIPEGEAEGSGTGRAAEAALNALVLHRTVAVHAVGQDRYGRLLAHVWVEPWVQSTAIDDAGRLSVENELLAGGYALLAPVTETAACRSYLRDAERRARAAKLGLWGDPYHAAKRAEDVATVLAERGQLAVVSGRVVSVRESGAFVYVNFGWRWSEDFTVTILKRNERLFVGAGLDPKKLAGRLIEVRGWIEEHGGPAIEASRPEQIELIEGN